jgi:hypothetical protein
MPLLPFLKNRQVLALYFEQQLVLVRSSSPA